MNSSIDSRSKLLLGEDFGKIKLYKIAVIGLGGVGSIIPLSLVRSGVTKLILVDGDKVEITNLNRQIAYTRDDIGKFKSEVLKEKLFSIRQRIDVKSYPLMIDEKFEFNVFKDVDYLIDCIDDLKAKVLLAKFCSENDINYISSMGTGNRLNPEKLSVVKLNKATGDPLARKFRYLLKRENVDLSKVDVVFSSEEPMVRGKIVSSMVFVPNAAGLLLSSFVLRKLIAGE